MRGRETGMDGTPDSGGAVFRFMLFAGKMATSMKPKSPALERCRLAHGDYPETLDALTAQFIENCRTTTSVASRCIIAA